MPSLELLLLSLLAAICIAALPALIVVRHFRSKLASIQRELDAARSRETALRATDRAKDEFLAMLGHELRNPLAALAAVAHVLRAKVKDDAALNATDVLGRQVRHMSRLTEDLLDVSRVTRGKVSLNRRPLDLSRAVEHALGELKLAGRLSRHDLRLDLSPV